MVVVFGVATKIILTLIVKGGVIQQYQVMIRVPVGMLNITMSVHIQKPHKYLMIVVIRQRTTVINIRLLLPLSIEFKRYFA